MGIKSWLTTLGLGAGLMYFYDPEMGNRRRAQLRDQWTHLQNDAQDYWAKVSRDLQNRAQGMQTQKPSLRRGIGGMGGLRGNWSPGVRLIAGAAGGGLAVYGLARGGIKGLSTAFFGFNLVSRSLTDKDLRTLMSRRTDEGAVDVQKSMMIDRPVDEVFDFWRNFHNFPQFMSHLREVRDLGNGRSHWVAEGPAGTPVEWDATITELQPNRLIAWESVPGAQVQTKGRVRFDQVDGGTRVDVRMSYTPPAGALGHAVAVLFGDDPKSAMDDDMQRFKSLIEHGKTSAGDKTVTRDQVSQGKQTAGQAQATTHASAAQSQSQQKSNQGQTQGNQAGTGRAQSSKPNSGMPGGGQGRTDEVGRTGVYPASDPNAPSDAEAQGMASWGQGDRGAAGYEDSGSSELSLGEETGGFDSIVPGAPGEPENEEKKSSEQ